MNLIHNLPGFPQSAENKANLRDIIYKNSSIMDIQLNKGIIILGAAITLISPFFAYIISKIVFWLVFNDLNTKQFNLLNEKLKLWMFYFKPRGKSSWYLKMQNSLLKLRGLFMFNDMLAQFRKRTIKKKIEKKEEIQENIESLALSEVSFEDEKKSSENNHNKFHEIKNDIKLKENDILDHKEDTILTNRSHSQSELGMTGKRFLDQDKEEKDNQILNSNNFCLTLINNKNSKFKIKKSEEVELISKSSRCARSIYFLKNS